MLGGEGRGDYLCKEEVGDASVPALRGGTDIIVIRVIYIGYVGYRRCGYT